MKTNAKIKFEHYESNQIKCYFYTTEFQKVKHPEIFLMEKIIKKKGNIVKWLPRFQ